MVLEVVDPLLEPERLYLHAKLDLVLRRSPTTAG